MNVITTKNYVAGIFESWSDAQAYRALKPSFVEGSLHTNSDLMYPFYLLEMGDGRFVGYQTREEALAQNAGIILYTIEGDYQPHPFWTDQMGSLEHDHLIADPD